MIAFALATFVLAGKLSIVSPARWDVAATQNVTPNVPPIDLVLKNSGTTATTWRITNLPVWAWCPLNSDHPELGQRLSGFLNVGQSQTIRIHMGWIPPSMPVGKVLDEIAFEMSGSTAREIALDCSLTLAKAH